MLVFWMCCIGVNVKCNLNKYRKTNYLIGHGIVGLNWLFMALSYYSDSYIYPKIAGFLVAACCGGSFMVTYYAMVSEVCGASIIFISILTFLMANFLIMQVAPYILTTQNNYGSWCLGNSIISILWTLFGCYYFIETQGLEKKDVYDI